ncbi:MAG: transporter substrate-binding domain-containing protein [Oscillospiraceae bacterium]|nr:transporter substrate-binding domain-containing protein [Oscillospiraceae bacterium]
MKKKNVLFTAGVLLCACLTGCGGPAANTVFSADDLKGKTIGAQLGTTGYIYACDEVEDATVEPYNKGADAIQALKQGKIDAVIIDSEPAKVFVEKNDTLRILEDPFVEEEYAIAYKKGNDELGSKIDDAITHLKNDGTLDEITSHWIGVDADHVSYTPDSSLDRSNGKLIMATNAEFPPYESMESGEIVGVDVDMMNAVCDYLDMELVIENMEFDSIIAAVDSGKADVGVAGMSVTEDRLKNVSFTQGYTVSTQVIIVRKD